MINNSTFTTIYIVRHGEVDWNSKGLVLGQKDFPLNNKGKKQAIELKNHLKKINFNVIFSSDLMRANETAKIIAANKKIPLKVTNALREQSFGKYEGWEKQKFLKLFDKWQEMSNDERHRYVLSDDMESNEQAVNRFITFLREIVISHKRKTVLVVTHGALMRYLLINLGYSSYDYISHFDNTGYIKLESDGIDFFIKELKGFHKS